MVSDDLQTEIQILRKELELISRQNARWMVLNNLIYTLLNEGEFDDFLFSFLDGFQIMIGGNPMVFVQDDPDKWTWNKKDPHHKINKTLCTPLLAKWLDSLIHLRTFTWSKSSLLPLKFEIETPPLEFFPSVTNCIGFTHTKMNYKIIVLSINLPNPEFLLEYSRDILDLINPLSLMLRYVWIHNSLKEQNIELEKARLAAESANRAKSDFLANISHDLRTPLNGIMGFAEILRNQLLGTINFEQRDALNEIVDAGTHLTKLIEDLLDMSRMEIGKLKIECKSVSIRPILEKAIAFFQEKARSSSVRLHLEL